MNKSRIKILKKDKNIPPSTVSASGETINHFNVAHTINHWIAERRENSRAEKVASEGVIASWRRLSETSNQR